MIWFASVRWDGRWCGSAKDASQCCCQCGKGSDLLRCILHAGQSLWHCTTTLLTVCMVCVALGTESTAQRPDQTPSWQRAVYHNCGGQRPCWPGSSCLTPMTHWHSSFAWHTVSAQHPDRPVEKAQPSNSPTSQTLVLQSPLVVKVHPTPRAHSWHHQPTPCSGLRCICTWCGPRQARRRWSCPRQRRLPGGSGAGCGGTLHHTWGA